MINIENFNSCNHSNLEKDVAEILSIVRSWEASLPKDEQEEEQEQVAVEKKPVNVVKFDIDCEEAEDEEYLDQQIKNTLRYVLEKRVKLQSNFCRYNAELVSACASLGYISNVNDEGLIIDYWLITSEGLEELNKE